MALVEGTYVTIDEDRADEVFTLLVDAFHKRKGIFSNFIFPEDRVHFPDDPREKANWLFWMSLFMRGGVVSDDPVVTFETMLEIMPGIFDPEVARRMEPKEVEGVFQEANTERLVRMGKRFNYMDLPAEQTAFWFPGPPLPLVQPSDKDDMRFGRKNRRKTLPKDAGTKGYKTPEHAKNFVHNACVLSKLYDGDARNLFIRENGSYVDTFEEFWGRVDYERREYDGVYGWRRKIAALFHFWMEKFDLVQPGIPRPLVVDFHHLRVLYATGIITFKTLRPLEQSKKRKENNHAYPDALLGRQFVRSTEPLVDEIMLWSVDFLETHKDKFFSSDLTTAIWLLSREMCAEHPQARSSENRTKYIFSEMLESNIPLQEGNPTLCAYCPVETKCTGIFSSGPYYEFGIAVPDRRVRYPNPTLFDLGEFLRSVRSSKDRGARY